MAQFAVGDAVQVGTAAAARHGIVAALVTEPDGAQSYDVTMTDVAEPVRVREGDLAPFAGAAAQPPVVPVVPVATPTADPAQLVADAEALLQQAESEVKQSDTGQENQK